MNVKPYFDAIFATRTPVHTYNLDALRHRAVLRELNEVYL